MDEEQKEINTEYFAEGKNILTDREMEIALLACKGKTNQEIAKISYVTANTVKRAMWAIYGKLGINSREKLIKVVSKLIEWSGNVSPFHKKHYRTHYSRVLFFRILPLYNYCTAVFLL